MKKYIFAATLMVVSTAAQATYKGMPLYPAFQFECRTAQDCMVLPGVCPDSYVTLNKRYAPETQEIINTQAPFVQCALVKDRSPVPVAACENGHCKLPPHVPVPPEKICPAAAPETSPQPQQ